MRRVASALPEAHFVHLVRDGRDVALSQVEVDFGADQIADAARDWLDGIEERNGKPAACAHYIEVRYEDLVTEPDPRCGRCAVRAAPVEPGDAHLPRREPQANGRGDTRFRAWRGAGDPRRRAGEPPHARRRASAARARRAVENGHVAVGPRHVRRHRRRTLMELGYEVGERVEREAQQGCGRAGNLMLGERETR